jgi:hypothetical protein
LLAPKVAWSYGEAADGFPSWYERTLLVLSNEARCDPQKALDGCTVCGEAACYEPVKPMQWNRELNLAARFHAANLSRSSCGMMHDSPCRLLSEVGSSYPDSCDGSPSCACEGGSASCSGGQRFSDRIRLFYTASGYLAENIAWLGEPASVFRAWLWENSASPECSWSMSNGHRFNILNGAYGQIGIGGDGSYTVQDFSGAALGQKLPAGTHTPESGSNILFRANYYDNAGPQKALVNVGGSCFEMSLSAGSESNGTWSYNGNVSGCTRYYFVFTDAGGNDVSFPSTGSFGINCGNDWAAERPPAGSGCFCEPDCTGRVCGDDGCGGSCGSCSGAQQLCVDGACACAHDACGSTCCAEGERCANGACCMPDCADRQCGDDGCGGSCGDCASPLACYAGACTCAPGLELCAEQCVELQTNPLHCGQCDLPCAEEEVCSAGLCAVDCGDGLLRCERACVDAANDPQNCGGCGSSCEAGALCVEGKCVQESVESSEDPERVEPSDAPDAEEDGVLEELQAPSSDEQAEVMCSCRLGRPSSAPWASFALLLFGLVAFVRARAASARQR